MQSARLRSVRREHHGPTALRIGSLKRRTAMISDRAQRSFRSPTCWCGTCSGCSSCASAWPSRSRRWRARRVARAAAAGVEDGGARAGRAAVLGERRRFQSVRRERRRRAHEAHAQARLRHRRAPAQPAWLWVILALVAGSSLRPGGRSIPGLRCIRFSAPSSTRWCTRSGSSAAPGSTSCSAVWPAASPCSPARPPSIRRSAQCR